MTVKEFIVKQQEDRVKARENAVATQQAFEEQVQNAAAEADQAAQKPQQQG